MTQQPTWQILASERRAKGGEMLRWICTGERARREERERRGEKANARWDSVSTVYTHRLSREGEPHAERRQMPARGHVAPEPSGDAYIRTRTSRDAARGRRSDRLRRFRVRCGTPRCGGAAAGGERADRHAGYSYWLAVYVTHLSTQRYLILRTLSWQGDFRSATAIQ